MYIRINTTKDTPYLTCDALMADLQDVYYEDFGENWPHYNDTAL